MLGLQVIEGEPSVPLHTQFSKPMTRVNSTFMIAGCNNTIFTIRSREGNSIQRKINTNRVLTPISIGSGNTNDLRAEKVRMMFTPRGMGCLNTTFSTFDTSTLREFHFRVENN